MKRIGITSYRQSPSLSGSAQTRRMRVIPAAIVPIYLPVYTATAARSVTAWACGAAGVTAMMPFSARSFSTA